MNRREFVGAGATVAAALVVAPAVIGAPAARSGPRPCAVIFDRRYAPARRFAAAARQRGEHVRAIDADVTALWFEELQPLWSRGAGAVAGMTTAPALFCLEQLAWNHWFRVIARIEHHPGPAGTWSHRLAGQAQLLASAAPAFAGSGRAVGAAGVEPLVSWVIAA